MKASEQLAWKQFGKALPQSNNHHGIHPSVANAINSGGKNQRWLIACSGGADSVACAGWMTFLANALGHSVALAHYNHRWRGKESANDGVFVKDLAERLQVTCYIGEAEQIPQQATETAARSERMDFLRSQALVFSADAIVFGHHLNDVSESLLLRLGRGAGTEGMAAPRPVHNFPSNPSHWRPFLHVSTETLRNGLQAAGIPWREDDSNTATTHPRNALRIQVLPALEKLEQRSFSQGAARTRMLMEADADALDALARERLPDLFQTPPVMQWQVPTNIHLALLRRGFSAWLNHLQPKNWPPAAQLDTAVESLLSTGTISRLLQTDHFSIELREGWVTCTPVKTSPAESTRKPIALIPEVALEWLPDHWLRLEICTLEQTQRESILQGQIDTAREAWLDAETVQNASAGTLKVTARQRRPGDLYHPLGAPGQRKLARILMDKGIPQAERSRLPVVVLDKDTLLWIPGLPPAHDFRISATSKQALRLTYGASAST
jgi:tRNA(Ile)-lysidine synthase